VAGVAEGYTELLRYSGFHREAEEEAAGAAVPEAALVVLEAEDSEVVVPEEAGRKVIRCL